ncbi:MAG: NAD-dependent epimerase/dehydratase family protein [Verrucomicrobiales bacterium]|nr:NAD-dependent epimerase/dehydratase family protein [Verrucomicrobiales bacterium]
MRVLILGCGYVGFPLAVQLIDQGHEVIGLRRTSAGADVLAAAGVEVVMADLAHAEFTLPAGKFDWVVFAAAAGSGADEAACRALHVEGLRRVLDLLSRERPAKFVHLSSIGVYGQRGGVLVKETTATEPRTVFDRVQLESEGLVRAAANAGLPSVILRVAGVYGPDRMPRLDRFLRNEVRIEGQGTRHLNMVHRDDVVASILAALKNGRAGECYNVVDQEPVTETHFYSWLAEAVGMSMPPTVAAETDPGRLAEAVDEKVSNRRLTMELGCRLKYPNFRLGYTAELKRLGDAGLLDVPGDES